jgi:hypothetical protein
MYYSLYQNDKNTLFFNFFFFFRKKKNERKKSEKHIYQYSNMWYGLLLINSLDLKFYQLNPSYLKKYQIGPSNSTPLKIIF